MHDADRGIKKKILPLRDRVNSTNRAGNSSCRQILTKLSGTVGSHLTSIQPLSFGDDRDHNPYPGILTGVLTSWVTDNLMNSAASAALA